MNADRRLGERKVGRRLGRLGGWLAFAVVGALAVIFLFPLFWMLSTSLKTSAQVNQLSPVWWPPHPAWHNFPDALSQFPFWQYAWNTIQITIPVTIGTTLSSAVVAYGFARVRWPGRTIVFYLVLATLMIPTWTTLVPLYILFNGMGWVDTYKPLIVPSFFGDAFSIFLLRQFFLRLPWELDEAARVDGASQVRIFVQIVAPLSRPALSVVALFAFINTWTDFFNPLIYLNNPDKYTLQLGLYNFFSQHLVDWPGLMAASIVVVSPIAVLFFLTQRTFIEGITFTGMKG